MKEKKIIHYSFDRLAFAQENFEQVRAHMIELAVQSNEGSSREKSHPQPRQQKREGEQ